MSSLPHPPEPGLSPPTQGNLMMSVFIGCPPGKRLAFDITYTLEYNRLQNKHYFNCVHMDPEMPCFLFRDSARPVPASVLLTVLCPHLFALSAFAPHPSSAFPLGLLSCLPSCPPFLRSSSFLLLTSIPSDPTVFYPFFLIQDLVTGDSGSFQGR